MQGAAQPLPHTKGRADTRDAEAPNEHTPTRMEGGIDTWDAGCS